MDFAEALLRSPRTLSNTLRRMPPTECLFTPALSAGRGCAIVLPGRTFAGKSTLVAALLRAGAAYYSDEFAVLDEQGRVHPFPRLLAMRNQSGEADGKRGPDHFGGVVGTEALPTGLIAFLEYRHGAPERLQALSAARAAMQLVPYAYCATADPERAVFSIAKAVQHCRCLRGTRGEADATAQRLLRMIENEGQPSP